MALARPYWNRFSQAAVDPNQPVHAVVLVDNSLSMSYQKPDGILLDDAKAKAKELIEGLPSGSVISVLPTCGPASGVNYEAYARREDALEALAAIQPVDCAARSGQVIDRALEACRRTMSMAGRRIFLVTDQQVANWSADAEKEHLKQLPCPMQVVQVAPDQIENVWVADVQLRDGVANAQCPAVFIATIGYQGGEPRKGIPVVLKVDGRQVASQTIDLLPGQMREVVFPEYEFPKSSDSRPDPLCHGRGLHRQGKDPLRPPAGRQPAGDRGAGRRLAAGGLRRFPGGPRRREEEDLRRHLVAAAMAGPAVGPAGPGPAAGPDPAPDDRSTHPQGAGRRPAGGHRRRFAALARGGVALEAIRGTGRKPDSGGRREFRSGRLDGSGLAGRPGNPARPVGADGPGLCPRRSPLGDRPRPRR